MSLGQQHLDPAAIRWVGWHSFDLITQPGLVLTIDLRVGRDSLEILANTFAVAYLDRDQLREWLTHPDPAPLARDEVEWSVRGGITYLALGADGEYGPYVVPSSTVAYLTGVI